VDNKKIKSQKEIDKELRKYYDKGGANDEDEDDIAARKGLSIINNASKKIKKIKRKNDKIR
jgi:hypothetical protein